MRSPTHFDEVAARHGDRLTAYMEDAVDAADDEAEAASAKVTPKSKDTLQPPWVNPKKGE